MSDKKNRNSKSRIIYDRKNAKVEIEGSEHFSEKMIRFFWKNGLLDWDMVDMSDEISPVEDKPHSVQSISPKPQNSNETNDSQISESTANEYSEQILQISQDARDVPIEKIDKIFHFDKDPEIPFLTVDLDETTRTGKQRPAVLLILYAHMIITGDDSLKTNDFKDPLQLSGIDPDRLSNIMSGDDEFVKWVNNDGQTYTIQPLGKISARKLLSEIRPYH